MKLTDCWLFCCYIVLLNYGLAERTTLEVLEQGEKLDEAKEMVDHFNCTKQ